MDLKTTQKPKKHEKKRRLEHGHVFKGDVDTMSFSLVDLARQARQPIWSEFTQVLLSHSTPIELCQENSYGSIVFYQVMLC